MERHLSFLLFTLAVSALVANASGSRDPRLFPFQIIRFDNDPCTTDNNLAGTCYTSEECSNKGGRASGTCAASFGVCCLFQKTCGDTVRENCTYFANPENVGAGDCRVSVCPSTDDISQIRLDFSNFVIAGPSSSTQTTYKILRGDPTPDNAEGVEATVSTQCLTDTFSVTRSGTQVPVICGSNTGEHLYLDSTAECNELVFQLGNNFVDTSAVTRSWNIKITQYDRNSPNLAPVGCTQYFFGSAGQVQTFNYAGNQHLSDQRQVICVRRERTNCRICWTTVNDQDFAVSGNMAVGANTRAEVCCGWGLNEGPPLLMNNFGFDCVTIPNGVEDEVGAPLEADRVCGRNAGLAFAGRTATTFCSTVQPFSITFRSDSFETMAEVDNGSNKGFKLVYSQDTNC